MNAATIILCLMICENIHICIILPVRMATTSLQRLKVQYTCQHNNARKYNLQFYYSKVHRGQFKCISPCRAINERGLFSSLQTDVLSGKHVRGSTLYCQTVWGLVSVNDGVHCIHTRTQRTVIAYATTDRAVIGLPIPHNGQ